MSVGIKKILIPFDVCGYCTLIEAVKWISHKEYPVEKDDRNYERFDELSFSEIYREWEKIRGEERFEPSFNKQQNTRFKQHVDGLKKKRQSQLEAAKYELLVALRKGELEAYGLFHSKMKEGYDSSQWNKSDVMNLMSNKMLNMLYGNEPSIINDDPDMVCKTQLYDEDIFLDTKRVQKIPSSFWNLESINWDGEIRSPNGGYMFIHFDFDDLIRVFKESEPEITTVEKRSGYLFYDDKNDELTKKFSLRKLGRKPVIDWDIVYAHIALEITRSENNRLSKQDSFAQEIKDWIAKELRQDVGISTIKAKLKPYYSVFKK